MSANRSTIQRLLSWKNNNIPQTVDAAQYAEAFGRFKTLLIEQYQRRLQTKTARRLPINLSAKPTHFGTSAARAALYFDKQTIESEDIASEVDKILNTHDRLLIIGDPGAGKTTILLFAAVNILQHQQDPKLPLIVNLATWRTDNDFADWYAQSMAHTYGLSPGFVQELLRRNAVIPFFDGFDEVSEHAREDCFQKMAVYFSDQLDRQMIVSSRKKEYAAVKADAPVYAEIEVQPLSQLQIQKALFENGQTYKSDLALFHAMGLDEPLAKAMETPFYLNTASFLFAKGERTVFDFPFKASTAEGRQRELVELFVEEQVPKVEDRKYLGFLASKMEEEKFLVFELVKMQPGWGGKLWRYRLMVGGLGGLVVGGVLGMLFGFRRGMFTGPDIGISIGLSAWIVVGLIIGSVISKDIKLVEIRIWQWHIFLKNWKRIIVRQLFWGMFYGAAIGLAMFFAFNLGAFFIHSLPSSWMDALIFVPSMGLPGGLLFGIVSGLNESGKTNHFLLHVPRPYQRFLLALKLSFWGLPGVLTAICFGYISYQLTKGYYTFEEAMSSIMGWKFSLFWMPVLFLIPLLQSRLLQHLGLRLLVFIRHQLPLRLVTFLDRMSEQYIFEDNRPVVKGKKLRGATWRFRHKILQDYFAMLSRRV